MNKETPLSLSKRIVLTDEQTNAVNTLLQWLRTPTQFTASLKGSAGSGKTTTLKKFIEMTSNRVSNTAFTPKSLKIAVTAPTHKAKKVVAAATGKEAITIHSLLGLKPDLELTEFDINNTIFSAIGINKMSDYSLVIIDESSMLNQDLFDLLIASSKSSKTKILFVGDPLQLPPVKEDICKALNDTDVVVELTSVIRQAESNPCSLLLLNMRDNIVENKNFIHPVPLFDFKYDTKEGYQVYDKKTANEFFTNMRDNFLSENFEMNPDYVKFVAFTNVKVTEACTWIRKQILSARNIKEDIICVKDVITAYRTVNIGNKDEDIINVLTNSEDYLIEDVQVGSSDGRIQGRYVSARNVTTRTLHKFFVVDPISYSIFGEVHDTYYQAAVNSYGRERGKNWEAYYDFKNRHLLNQAIKMPNGKFIPKDFDFAYAITVHKSQGSTYNNVYVDWSNISTCRDKKLKNKLLYVAASRASNQIHII
jgi:hypothetical protein